MESTGSSERIWNVFGSKIPKAEIVFFCQVLVLYVMIGCSIYNLTVNSKDSQLWTAILCSSMGYLLPNPKIKQSKHVLPHVTE